MNAVATHISNWLKDYALKIGKSGYVVGVSGGVDSAVTSTLCAMTGLTTVCLLMPIHQAKDQHHRGERHIRWLNHKYNNVWSHSIDLTEVYEKFISTVIINDLAKANTRARLRMTTLYALATTDNLLVAGTGNLIEDFGIGFYTKHGDGAVDVSPIGSLTKTEVWELGRHLGINQEIIDAIPTDGLHSDNRSDEDQIGASYEELEWAMEHHKMEYWDSQPMTERQKQIMKIYLDFHEKNAHKMAMPPTCPRLP